MFILFSLSLPLSLSPSPSCVCICVHASVCACVHACVHACLCEGVCAFYTERQEKRKRDRHTDRKGRRRIAHLQVQVDEPGEGVLVHGLNVGQVRDAEEEDGGVDSHRLVAVSCLVNQFLCGSCDILLGRDLLGQDLGGGEDPDGSLILQNVTLWEEFKSHC